MAEAGFTLPGENEAQIYTFEKFGTLNTKANRPAIKDEEFSYLLNWMPVGDGNLRALHAEGAVIYTVPAGKTIIYYYPFNFGEDNFFAVFLSDGTAIQVNEATGAVTSISSTVGQFYDGTTLPECSQWEAQYLVIVTVIKATPNSYFVWDGMVLYQAGSLSPDITLSNGGKNYTTPPTVTAFGGSGTSATFTATIENGSVTQVTPLNPGSGYLVTDDTPQLVFSGGGSDTTATATAAITTSAGGVASVAITNSGTGYTTTSTLAFSGGGGSGAQAVISGLVNGSITQVTITAPGTGYTSNPTIAASGGGSGFTADVDVRYGYLTGITVVGGGSGYSVNPQVVIGPPDSTSLPVLQAEAIATVSGGAVTGFTLTQAGLGYTKPPTVTLVGGNNAAAGTVTLMPFGIAGTTVETFSGAVWVGNGTKASFTAPDTLGNFATSAGGGSFQSTDNFLRNRFVSFKQTNGTLYLIGDSSINGISNVQTSTSNGVSTTTFNNSNIDPQTGTPWRDSVTVFGRAILFANSSGIYALYGGAAEKVSGPLDGLFAQATFNTGTAGGVVPTSAVCTLFSIRCYVFLFTFVDSYSGVLTNEMAIWDGTKWFLGSQVNSMSFLTTSEIDSNLTAYGSTGQSIYPLFTTPSTSLTKTLQTKLRPEPSMIIVKQVNRVYFAAQTPLGATPTLNISVDTERGSGPVTPEAIDSPLIFVGTGPITFVGTGPITFGSSGLVPVGFNPQASYGQYVGLTASTTASDITLLSLSYIYRTYSPKV